MGGDVGDDESPLLSKEQLQKIKQFVVNGKRHRLNSLLETSAATTLEGEKNAVEFALTKLLPSTPLATSLLSLFRRRIHSCVGDNDTPLPSKDLPSADELLRALLMINPTYSTPWQALCVLANSFALLDFSDLVEHATTVEDFLVSATETSPNLFQKPNKRRKLPSRQGTAESEEISTKSSSTASSCIGTTMFDKDTAEGMLIGFSEGMLQHFEVESDTNNKTSLSNGHTALLSDLMYCILRTAKMIDDQLHGILDAVVSKIFVVGNFQIATFLQILQRTHHLLRNEQLKEMANQLLEQFCNKSIISQQLLPEEIPPLLSLVLDMTHMKVEVSRKKLDTRDTTMSSTWQTIAVHIFSRAFSVGQECFVSAEQAMSAALQQWSCDEIHEFVSNLSLVLDKDGSGDIPHCLGLAMFLVCFETLKEQSPKRWSMSDAILGELYPGNQITHFTDSTVDFLEKSYDILLHLGINKHLPTDQSLEMLAEGMDKLRYDRHGAFVIVDENEREQTVSLIGGVIWDVLFLGRTEEETGLDLLSALGRAQRMARMLESVQGRAQQQQLQAFSIFWVVFVGVAYFEIPQFRGYFVDRMRTQNDNEMATEDAFDLDFSALAFLVTLSEKVKDEKGDGHILVPFEDLLDDEDIQPWFLFHLSSLLGSISSMRSVILQSTKRMLAPLHFYPCSVDAEPDPRELDLVGQGNEFLSLTTRVESAILCLLDLLRKESWGEVETKAWALLSDAIVLDTPRLCFEMRLWLYRSVSNYLADNAYSEAVKHHLLMSLTIRQASLFHGTRNVTANYHVQEVSAVHRLIFTLLQSLAVDSENCRYRLELLALGREAFLRFALCSWAGESMSQKPIIDFIQEKILDDNSLSNDGFALCWALTLSISVLMMESLSFRGVANARNRRSRVDKGSADEFDAVDLKRRIQSVEIMGLNQRNTASADCQWILPSWVGSSSSQLEELDTSWFDRKIYQNSFICLLLELLYSVPLPTRFARDVDGPLSWKMIKATGHLLSQESHEDYNEATKSEGQLFLDCHTIEQTGQSFLSLSSILVRDVVRRDFDLCLAEELFNAIVTYCDSISTAFDESMESPDILVSLWDLYNGLASERSAVSIVLYLENHLSDDPKTLATSDGAQFEFLNPLQSSKDVNRAIRSLRVSCLRALSTAVPRVNAEQDEAVVPKDLVAGMLEALAEDLRKGLAGDSGGISSQLYMSYCFAIEKCANAVFEEARTDGDCSVVSLFGKVSNVLSDILVVFPLGAAERFKTTFVLGLVSIPSMCRSVQRRSLVRLSNVVAEKLPENLNSDTLDTCFDDCLVILSRWSTLRDPLSVPWEDIAGRHHCKSPNNSETSVVSLGSHDDKQPIVGSGQSVNRIRLTDKEVWSWALSCSLFGLKRLWLDSYGVIQVNTDSDEGGESAQVDPHTPWRTFINLRKGELQEAMAKIVRFFHPSTDTQEQVALDMLAMNMPSHPRELLCSVVACASQVLTEASKRIGQLLKEEVPDNNLYSLSMLESLCCLAAWLSIDADDTKAVATSDFSVGVFKWLEMASRKRPPQEQRSSSKRADSKDMMEKVSCVAEYVYQLYLSLKDLERCLRRQSATADFHKVCKSFFMNDGINRHHPHASVGTSGSHTDLLLHYVTIKIRMLLKVLPREYRERSLPDFPAIVTKKPGSKKRGRSSMLGGLFSRHKTQQQQQRNKRARFTAMNSSRMSRNPALEALWALDQEADREQDGKKAAATRKKRNWNVAAAADLEDFITPG
jgi:hypothetical protein